MVNMEKRPSGKKGEKTEKMRKTTMYFPESTLVALKHKAAEELSNVTAIVIRAVKAELEKGGKPKDK
jgi:hypothetical protein